MRIYSMITATGFIVSLGACGAQDLSTVGKTDQDLQTDNGLSINGLSINGLSINGLSINGLSINGLSINGLATSTFSTWFNQNVATTPAVMSYIVKCALPAGSSLSWINSATGMAYSWAGELGLAPTWASGQAPTTTEQQLITACLAAHTNKYGVHIPFAVEGQDSTGAQIPMASGELATYSVREGCFFGNLFTDEGIFAGNSDILYGTANSSPRACALEPWLTSLGPTTPCAPMVNVGMCSQYCRTDPTGVYYTSCTYKGNTYQPLATRIRPSDVYTCGDGVCQFTESCGIGLTANSCWLDCGVCPGRG